MSSSDTIVAATHPDIAWMGRTAPSGAGGVRCAYPGIAITLCSDATRVAIRAQAATADCYVDVAVDGGAASRLRLSAGAADTVVADGLAPGVAHRIVLVRRTESWMGAMTVDGVVLSGGRLLPAPPPSSRRLLFIGDSITCGACVEQLPPDYPDGHGSCNAARSFGMELGRRLAAQVHLVSYGGRGVIRDWQGLGNDAIANAPVFFERALPDDPASAWDHAAYQPDAVVVGLGTNDFNQGIPDERVWTAAYAAFLARIRAVHPKARIIITSSPMFGPRVDNGDRAKAASHEHYLDETVLLRAQAGDHQVEAFRYRHMPGSAKNAHPTAPQHLLMADDLEPLLRARLPSVSG